MTKVHRMGDFIVEREPSTWETSGASWEYNRRGGNRCPVCLDVIADGSTTCHHCVFEWKAIKADPSRLAWWIAQAVDIPELRDVVVWGERPTE